MTGRPTPGTFQETVDYGLRLWQERDAVIERVVSVMREPCSLCEGAGHYWDDQTGQPDSNGGSEISCYACEGTGVEVAPCIVCGAYGGDHDEGCMADPEQGERAT